MVQSATDIFVGWGSLEDRDFYVRQYRDMKIIPTTDLIAPILVDFATACGNTLARAHARSGDPVAIDAYMGKNDEFTKAMRRFARRYADQNERDHMQLVSAIRRGKVERRAELSISPRTDTGCRPLARPAPLLGQEEQRRVVGEVDQRLGPHAEEHGHARADPDGQPAQGRDGHRLRVARPVSRARRPAGSAR